MTILAMSLPSFFGGSSYAFKDIFSIRCKFKMSRVTASPIVAKMIKYRNIFTFTRRNRSHQPRIHQSMSSIENLVNPNLAVAIIQMASPNPTASGFKPNLLEYSIKRFWWYAGNRKYVHNTSITDRGTYVN